MRTREMSEEAKAKARVVREFVLAHDPSCEEENLKSINRLSIVTLRLLAEAVVNSYGRRS